MSEIRGSWLDIARRTVRRGQAFLPRRPKPTILMYHRIGGRELDTWGLSVSLDNFRRQLDWLVKARTILPLALFARREARLALDRDAVAITFDDGYASVAQAAVPLLTQMGIPVTIFVAPGLMGTGSEFWWDELEQIILQRAKTLTFEGATISLRNEEERRETIDRLWSRIREKSAAEIDRAMTEIRRQTGGRSPPRLTHRPMTAREARAIGSTTITFGSHTESHAWLPGLSRDEKRREIERSVALCEAAVGQRPTALAYPFGDHGPEDEVIAANAGYDCACTTQAGAVEPNTRSFALPRLAVGDWTPEQLRRALARL